MQKRLSNVCAKQANIQEILGEVERSFKHNRKLERKANRYQPVCQRILQIVKRKRSFWAKELTAAIFSLKSKNSRNLSDDPIFNHFPGSQLTSHQWNLLLVAWRIGAKNIKANFKD
jgi:hypothetical protein